MHGHGTMLDGLIQFDQEKIGYIQNPYNDLWKVNSGLLHVNNDYLNSLKKYNLVIVDMSQEHWGTRGAIDSLATTFTDNNINYVILSHEPNDHAPDNNIIFYPLFYHWGVQNFQRTKIAFDLEKSYKLGCLNSNPRPHRIANFLKLSNKSYFESCSITFSDTRDSGSTRDDDIELTNDELLFWNIISPTLPNKKPPQHLSFAGINLPALTDSYTHLVTEACIFPRLFVTEKVWKPVASGQLFFVLGTPGTINYLRNCGVDVFDDYIDHAHYDNEQDWRKRLELLYEVIDDFMTKDLYSIHMQTLERRIANHTKFYQGLFDTKYREILLNLIKQHS